MSESEWRIARDPDAMLECLRGTASSRELRLFAVVCVKRIWPHLTNGCRRALQVAEDFAHGRADDAKRRAHHVAVNALCIYVDGDSSAEDRLHGFAAEAALNCVFGEGDYLPIPTYPINCAAAAARAVVEVVAAECEMRGEPDAACEERVSRERQWQCDTIRASFVAACRK